jgi:hypothetical protein
MTFALESSAGSRVAHRRPADHIVARHGGRRADGATRTRSRSSRAVYRRRRTAVALVAALTVIVMLRLADLVVGGDALATASERLVTVLAFVGWGWAALALLRWDRSTPSASGAESGESCRSLDPAPSLPLAS